MFENVRKIHRRGKKRAACVSGYGADVYPFCERRAVDIQSVMRLGRIYGKEFFGDRSYGEHGACRSGKIGKRKRRNGEAAACLHDDFLPRCGDDGGVGRGKRSRIRFRFADVGCVSFPQSVLLSVALWGITRREISLRNARNGGYALANTYVA